MTTSIQSNYLKAKMINHTLRNTAYTTPGTSVYVALHLADPTDAGTGTEASFTNYTRVQVTAWDAPSGGVTQNTNQIDFATAGATQHVSHIGIWDDPDPGEGNLLFYGELVDDDLATPRHKDVAAGVTFSIAAGDIHVTIGGSVAEYLANAWLSHVLRNTAYTSPGTSIYVALYNTGPTEVTGTDYARVQVTAWDAPGATDGATENTNEVLFPTPGGDWNAVTHTGILDASSSGHQLFGPGAQDTSYSPTKGDVVHYVAGALDVTVS